MNNRSNHLTEQLQNYANLHIKRSFEYLLISTYFGNYKMNREGFEKVFRKLSDETWNDGIELIKHIAKRGRVHSFTTKYPDSDINEKKIGNDVKTYEDYELQTMARALDIQKHLAEKALEIHRDATSHKHSDAEIAHYIEEKFAEKQAESVRTIAGHVTDLRQLLVDGKDGSLALHMFDEYLSK